MILIITHKSDFTADFLIDKLNKRQLEYFRMNCEDLPEIGFSVKSSTQFSFELHSNLNFKSVWFRRTKLPSLDYVTDPYERAYLSNEYDALMTNFYQTVSAERWLSFPDHIYRAENKLLQLKIAKKVGFLIPDTLITNNKSELEAFAKHNSYDIILKPLSQGRINYQEHTELIFTNRLKRDHVESLDKYELTPCIYQRYVEKEYELRVTVVGNQIYSAKVDSQEHEETKVDWRKKKLLFSPYNLPKRIEEKCLELLHGLNLKFGAIDLIKSSTGEYYFLEINPNGQWAWIEMDTRQPIAESIIKYLSDD
jgi:hypothetical protein